MATSESRESHGSRAARAPCAPRGALQEVRLPVQVRLAAAWTTVVLLYAYVDILAFYKPGVVDDILVGVVWEFAITQTWALTALTLLAIPILMIVLSTILPARVNRMANLAVASVQIPFAAFNAVGQVGAPWMFFYILGVALELFVLAVILRTAWTWPCEAVEGQALRTSRRRAAAPR